MIHETQRRHFLKTLGLGTAAGLMVPNSFAALTESVQTPVEPTSNVPPNRQRLVNAYYYAPHNHCLLATHLNFDMAKMASIGTDIISFCVQEDQLENWDQQRVHNAVQCAHEHGLKVHAVPNRWCGMLAGWLDGYSNWSIRNRDTWLPVQPGKEEAFSDPNHPKVATWFQKNLKRLFTDFSFDGVIWDEPRPFTNVDVFFFLDRMSAYVKTVKPDATISMFAESTCLQLKDILPKLTNIDYVGSDGHVRSKDHHMHRMKTTIFEAHETFYEPLKKAGRKTVFLLEGQRHRDEDLQNYLENIDRAVNLPMDQLMYYYSAHEMSLKNEKTFNDATWRSIAALKGISYKGG